MYLDHGDARIYYEYTTASGSQTMITLINGHTRSSSDFRMMTKTLVAAGISVLSFDNRGAGLTESQAAFSIDDMAGDVLALWAELGITRSHVLGISMGGMIGQKLAKQCSDQLESLILVSTAAGQNYIKSDDGWGETYQQTFAKMKTYVSAEFAKRNKILVEAMAKQIFKSIESGEFAAKAAAQRSALQDIDLSETAVAIDADCLIIHGSDDQIIPVAAATDLAEKIPNASLRIIDGAGHLLLAEAPKKLYQIVIEFIEG